MTDYVPVAYGTLLSWLLNFTNYLRPHRKRFGIEEEKIDLLQVHIDNYKAAYEKAEHPNAGRADRLDRKEKAVAATKALRGFVNEFLRFNTALNDDDRIQLGLHVQNGKPTPVLKPETWPMPTVRNAGPRQVRIDYHDSRTATKAKPHGVHGCEIRYSILDSPPESLDDLPQSQFSTRSSQIFVFDENRRGKSIYFCLRWENTRGEKGPWSEIVSVIIP